MSEPFLGEMRMFAGNFAPRGWALCDGQILPINQNQSLFSLLGTTYGGDGRTTFALPDLRGRVPMHEGQGAGLSNHSLGEKSGFESVALDLSQIPQHTHTPTAYSGEGSEKVPAADRSMARADDGERNYSSETPDTTMQPTGSAGAGQGHSNMQPYLCIHWIIATQGLFPSRS
ncbi:tail fiber protein [Pontiellaceae bacterium B1224]|nr:tail fiber protein [Pontiellaceae bacterium B1224]